MNFYVKLLLLVCNEMYSLHYTLYILHSFKKDCNSFCTFYQNNVLNVTFFVVSCKTGTFYSFRLLTSLFLFKFLRYTTLYIIFLSPILIKGKFLRDSISYKIDKYVIIGNRMNRWSDYL